MVDSQHIMIVNNYTSRGGIPKSIAGMANAMVERGHHVTIMSQRPVPKFFYPLYKIFCKIRDLSLDSGKRAPLPLGFEHLQDMYALRPEIRVIPYSFTDKNLKIQKLRKRIKEIAPDVCICPLPDGSQLVWAATLMGTGIPYIYSERMSPNAMETLFWNRKGRLAAMSGADAIHLLLSEYTDSLPDFLKDRVHVIPNPVTISTYPANLDGKDEKILLWLGRLQDESKQCSLALDAFARINSKYPQWKMLVAGDGPDAQKIHSHAKILGLDDSVKFLGNVSSVGKIYSQAQAFCFSSHHEGLPNTLLEAMSYGLPCAAFADCDGVGSIITDGENGLLAPEMTAECLANTLDQLLGNSQLRKKLGEKARKSMNNYAGCAVYDAWDKLVKNTAVNRNNTVMDKFYEEPFASLARMSSRARQEWAGRDFGKPMPDALIYRLLFLFKKMFMIGAK